MQDRLGLGRWQVRPTAQELEERLPSANRG